jgi:hypothetical protein
MRGAREITNGNLEPASENGLSKPTYQRNQAIRNTTLPRRKKKEDIKKPNLTVARDDAVPSDA